MNIIKVSWKNDYDLDSFSRHSLAFIYSKLSNSVWYSTIWSSNYFSDAFTIGINNSSREPQQSYLLGPYARGLIYLFSSRDKKVFRLSGFEQIEVYCCVALAEDGDGLGEAIEDASAPPRRSWSFTSMLSFDLNLAPKLRRLCSVDRQ